MIETAAAETAEAGQTLLKRIHQVQPILFLLLSAFLCILVYLTDFLQGLPLQFNRTMSSSPNTLSSSAEMMEFGERYVTNGLGRLLDSVIVKGEGSYVDLADGRRMLDFTCGIGVTGFGEFFF